MKINIKKNGLSTLLACATFVAAASAVLFAQPAYAGYWGLTSSVTGSYTAGSWGSGMNTTPGQSSFSFTDFGGMNGSAINGSFTYSGTIQWVGPGTAPATVTISESANVYGSCLYVPVLPASTSASDGLGDAGVTTTTTGYPGNSQTTTSKGSHSTTVAIAPGGSYHFTRSFANHAFGGSLNEGNVTYSVSAQ